MTLGWSGNEQSKFTLQSQQNGSWKTIYEGPDKATTLTGLSNGDYAFRVREKDADWSAPLQVQIKHHPLWKAWAFFTCGLVLFLILCALLFLKPISTDPTFDQSTGRPS